MISIWRGEVAVEYKDRPKAIIAQVADEFGFSPSRIVGRDRTLAGTLALARFKAMYRVYRETNLSLPQVGKRFGGRDHSTVLNGIRRYETWLQEDRRDTRSSDVKRSEWQRYELRLQVQRTQKKASRTAQKSRVTPDRMLEAA